MKRRVRFVNPKVYEKRLTLGMAFLDEGNGALDVVMDVHLRPGTVEGSIIVKPVFGQERGIGDHVVGEMPFAIMGGGIPGLFKKTRQHGGLRVKPIGHVSFLVARNPGEVAIDVITGRKMAGHDGCTAWGTNPAGYREAMEVSSLLGQPVDIGRLEVRMSMTAQVSPTPVIRKDENDIGAILGKNRQAG